MDTKEIRLYLQLEELAEALQNVDTTDLEEADRKVKKMLGEIFPEADFEGQSLFSLGADGMTRLETFFTRMAPVIATGAEQCAQQLVAQAKNTAEGRKTSL